MLNQLQGQLDLIEFCPLCCLAFADFDSLRDHAEIRHKRDVKKAGQSPRGLESPRMEGKTSAGMAAPRRASH